MAKHPHRLMFIDGRTWRCTLEGCAFFVHKGLAHVLEGKNATCWECGEIFRITADSLKEVMPRCTTCRTGQLITNDITAYIEHQLKERHKQPQEADQIEVTHAADCLSHVGGECTCR